MKLITSNLKLKLKGKHTTIIGGRNGYKIIDYICKHDMIKGVVPSIIVCKKKNNNNNKSHAKVNRPDEHGNLILLLSFGDSIQEIRLITYVKNF